MHFLNKMSSKIQFLARRRLSAPPGKEKFDNWAFLLA
jgi:hypothetical protein